VAAHHFKPFRAMTAILDNPIAVRDWRRLRRRAGNWRAYAGWTKQSPLDGIVGVVTNILSFSVAPYGLWLILACLCHRYLGKGDLSDIWSALALWISAFVVMISVGLGVTTITHEREQGTWDQLRLTAMRPRERGEGFMWGHLGPVWVSVLATAGIWWLWQPSYSALWTGSLEGGISRSAIVQWALVTLGLSFLAGEVGLQTSARCESTTVAGVMAGLIAAPLVIAGAAGLGGPLLMSCILDLDVAPFGSSHPLSPTWQAVLLLFCFWCLVSLCAAVWNSFIHRRET
jgi:hypothetical protein